jgi:hypothetical protein
MINHKLNLKNPKRFLGFCEIGWNISIINNQHDKALRKTLKDSWVFCEIGWNMSIIKTST